LYRSLIEDSSQAIMGNALVTISGDGLATAAVAKYLKITKDSVWSLRNSLVELSNPNTMQIGRHLFQIAVSRSGIRPKAEGAVLNLLFTMFDADGRDYVHVHDFIVGIAPLSCPSESLSQMLRFCLQINDFDDTGEVCANQLVHLLQSMSHMLFVLAEANCSYNANPTCCLCRRRELRRFVLR
jgi:Ca2+-binding EF-hand superfamily protein